jgi:hypothetical protein
MALTERWTPPKSKSGTNQDGIEARVYYWDRGVVVENVGFADACFRAMTPGEKRARIFNARTGEEYTDVISYSTVMKVIERFDTDEFGLTREGPDGNVLRINESCACLVKEQAVR